MSTVLILDMCIFRGLAVLRKALDQFVSIEKNSVLLKMISWQGFRGSSCPTTISRVTRFLVERRLRVIKDKTPKNTTWLFLDHRPLCRTGRVSRDNKKMFEYPLKTLLDHAWSNTEPPAIRISSRKAMPHVVTMFQRSTRIL